MFDPFSIILLVEACYPILPWNSLMYSLVFSKINGMVEKLRDCFKVCNSSFISLMYLDCVDLFLVYYDFFFSSMIKKLRL